MKILFFIGSLGSGGKERRLVELLTYLKEKEKYELFVVLAYDQIYYPAFKEQNIPYIILNKKPNFKDPILFIHLYKIYKVFKPDIIHTWGSMQSFYMVPICKIFNVPLVNSQITNARPKREKLSFASIINLINFKLSDVVLSNSIAGLKSFGLSENRKYRVIYNGFNMKRTKNLPSKEQGRKKFKINTEYSVVMVASFSENKDYRKLLDVHHQVCKKRQDITFLAAGDGKYLEAIKAEGNALNVNNLKFTGRIMNVEELIHACDIGLLFTNVNIHGEGISNAIMEYMALGKPVIANDAGGTKEIVNSKNGFLITNENPHEIAEIIIWLIDNPDLRIQLGDRGRKIIHEKFNLEKMGSIYEKLYDEVLINKR